MSIYYNAKSYRHELFMSAVKPDLCDLPREHLNKVT